MQKKLRRIHIALILSAASGLIYEVVATNLLFFYFIENTYSIATVLSVFLFGLGTGSFLVYKFKNKIKNPSLLFGISQLIIGTYSLIILTNLIEILPQIHTLGVFISSFLILLPPTIFLGAVFPLAGRIIGENKQEVIGLVYSVDLAGAVAGSLIAGFWLIPFFGNKLTVLFAVILNLIAAFVIIKNKRKVFILILITAISFFMINGQFSQANAYFKKPSPYGEVSIIENVLFINGRPQCFIEHDFSKPFYSTQIVNYSLNPLNSSKLKVLNIGLGCGVTLSEILKNTDLKVDVVEINPVVVEANEKFSSVLKNPGVNLIIDDGLNYLRNINKKYDSIIIDIENPTAIHSSDLFTKEAFHIINSSLSSGGIFGLWVYHCVTDNEKLKSQYPDIVFYTLKDSFEYVYQVEKGLFIASNQELAYSEYFPKSNNPMINTLDKKILSKLYYDNCELGENTEYLFKEK